jgi:hypothetical protein
MSGTDPMRERGLRVAATAANGAEAELITQRLQAAGIQSVVHRSIGGPEFGEAGPRYVYVEAADVDRAHELLEGTGEAEDQGEADEDDLAGQGAEIASNAGGPGAAQDRATEQTPTGHTVPVPGRDEFFDSLRRLSGAEPPPEPGELREDG